MDRLVCIVGVLLALASSENLEKATLILYREREFLGNAHEIRINEKLVASLPANAYLEIQVTPGKTNVESYIYRGSKRVFSLQTEAGQVYYIKAYEEVDFWDRYLVMQSVGSETATKEMKKCRKVQKVKQPD